MDDDVPASDPARSADEGSATRWRLRRARTPISARFALAAVDEFKMGQTPGTDYLAVSFSMLDAVGHAFGPRSHEVQDVLFRLDRDDWRSARRRSTRRSAPAATSSR